MTGSRNKYIRVGISHEEKKIAVIGSYVTDLTARAPGFPKEGETIKGSSFCFGCGGKGSNQAIAAKRAGADVLFITKVGNDFFGDYAKENFKKEGLNTDYIFTDEKNTTGSALIIVNEKTSQNEIVVTLDACGNITKENLKQARGKIKQADIILLQLEINIDAVESIINDCYSEEKTIILNPAPVQLINDSLLSKIDIIVPNEVEAEVLTGAGTSTESGARKAAQIFMDKGVKNVIITLGKNGVYASNGNEEKFIKCVDYKPAVDTTGAGDAFNGGFATALAEGFDFFEAVEFANAVAALAVTKYGTAPAMPFRQEIDDVINNKG